MSQTSGSCAAAHQRELFYERSLRSHRDTRADGREFLALAGQHRLNVTTTAYLLQAANQALG